MPSITDWTSDNVTEVVVKGLWSNNHVMVNVFHVKRTEDSPEQSARDVLDNWQDLIGGVVLDNYVLIGCSWRDRNETGGATGQLNPNTGKPAQGGGGSAAASPGVAVLVHKLISAHAGIRAGRFYMPPPAEEAVDENGRISSTTLGNFDAALNSFFNGLDNTGGLDTDNQLVVVKKREAVVGNSTASDVVGLKTDPIVASQRRRQR